jgi:predicted small metal-binding protein
MINLTIKEVRTMDAGFNEYKQLSCRDFGTDCDFMVRAKTAEETMKYGQEHGCTVHGKCAMSLETEKKMKSLMKNVWVRECLDEGGRTDS